MWFDSLFGVHFFMLFVKNRLQIEQSSWFGVQNCEKMDVALGLVTFGFLSVTDRLVVDVGVYALGFSIEENQFLTDHVR